MLATTFAATDPATSTTSNTLSPRLDLRESARHKIAPLVENAVWSTPAFDIHTHLFPPAFGDLAVMGIDELLTYHYLVAEGFRYLQMPHGKFWAMDKTAQADLIWQQLFIAHSPISEACRGVLTTLNKLGLDVAKRDLPSIRKWFEAQDKDEYVSRCMQLANVKKIAMTNSPFDADERPLWREYSQPDDRFAAGLRIDPLLLDWQSAGKMLADENYKVQPDLSGETFSEIQRFLGDWTKRMQPLYAMVSLPPTFAFPDSQNEKTACAQILENAVLPFCRERKLPLALMMGVQRAVNPNLKMAGDGVGRSDLSALQNLLQTFPDNKFLVTVLSRENQQELCVLARKFSNLHIFGCWWFMNTPSLINETTRMRLELLGTSFTPQHSDARVIDQIIYKWDHTRAVLAEILVEKYTDLAMTGWTPGAVEIERDVKDLLGGAFESFIAR
jgi:hypothetical protein